MRAFDITLRDGLWRGIRTDHRAPINTEVLVDLLNVKSDEMGLFTLETIVDRFADRVDLTWPFPQLIHGRGTTLLFDKTSLKEVDTSVDKWTLTSVTTYDAFEFQTQKAIKSGSQWHFADFFGTWFAFNGSCVLFRWNISQLIPNVNTDVVFVADAQAGLEQVSIQTGCDLRGRLLMGGFEADKFWTSAWETLWSAWESDLPSNFTSSREFDTNYVLWSSIGGGDALFYFYADLAMYGMFGVTRSANANSLGVFSAGHHDTGRPLWFDYLRRNDLGWMPMPWQGTVQKLAALSKAAMVYGTGGVSALPLHTEPVSTLGLVDFKGLPGIASRGAAGGSESRQVWVDLGGDVWTIDNQLQPQRLGYRELFKDRISLGDEINVSYDPKLDEFYIGLDDRTYLLTRHGMSRLGKLVTSVARINKELVGVAKATGESGFMCETGLMDMKSRAFKTITTVTVGASAKVNVYISVFYRHEKSAPWRQTMWFPCSNEGVAYPNISGTDFRIAVRSSDTTIDLDYITITYQTPDKRASRSINVSSFTPGTNT